MGKQRQELVGARVRVVTGHRDIDNKSQQGALGVIKFVEPEPFTTKHPYQFAPQRQDDRGEWVDSGKWTWLNVDTEFEATP